MGSAVFPFLAICHKYNKIVAVAVLAGSLQGQGPGRPAVQAAMLQAITHITLILPFGEN